MCILCEQYGGGGMAILGRDFLLQELKAQRFKARHRIMKLGF